MNRTALYRHYDASGRLLYVGVAADPQARSRKHKAQSAWWPQVDTTKIDWCLSRDHALDLERVAIRHECPLHNVLHKPVLPAAPTAPDLVKSIEAFCTSTGIGFSEFGRAAVNDLSLYRNLRDGREPRRKTVQRVVDFILTGQTHHQIRGQA